MCVCACVRACVRVRVSVRARARPRLLSYGILGSPRSFMVEAFGNMPVVRLWTLHLVQFKLFPRKKTKLFLTSFFASSNRGGQLNILFRHALNLEAKDRFSSTPFPLTNRKNNL